MLIEEAAYDISAPSPSSADVSTNADTCDDDLRYFFSSLAATASHIYGDNNEKLSSNSLTVPSYQIKHIIRQISRIKKDDLILLH
jgi:hypothetical protein